jgi:hypothetical protein
MTDKQPLKGVVDRFESKWAVIEIVDEIEPRKLPRSAKEGDHLQLEIEDGNIIQAKVDTDATAAAKARIKDKLDLLRRGEHLHDDE